MTKIKFFGTYPITSVHLRGLICRSTATKRIKNQVPGICGNQNSSFGDHQLQLVDPRPNLELFMAIGRSIGPEVRQVDPCRVHLVAMASVVADLAAAMPAGFDGQPQPVKHPRLALGVIEQRVMGRIKLSAPQVRSLHRQGNPVPESQIFGHNRGKLNRQLRCGIEEKRPARLYDAAALQNPTPTPLQVFFRIRLVVVAVFVVLTQVERWVGENSIDRLGFDPG